jgi:hypothetical protein
MMKMVGPERDRLLSHPIYEDVQNLAELQTFMESHSFAVWDFMSLLKSLQNRLTCVSVPWLPPEDVESARMINEIVLGEETDEVAPGLILGHYDLYVEAMGEVDANGRCVMEFVDLMRQGQSLASALEEIPVPQSTKDFVLNTLSMCQAKTHEVAAAFLLGRENIIPLMFQRLLDEVEGNTGMHCRAFRRYLARHIEVDGDSHGPMGERLLARLCGDDPVKWNEAAQMSIRAIRSRISLWDGLQSEIRNLHRRQNVG